MMLTVAVLALAGGGIALGARLIRPRPEPETLRQRVAELELLIPRYRTEMADLADRAESVLERAEHKRRVTAGERARVEVARGEVPTPLDRGDRKAHLRRLAGLGS